MLAGRVRDEPEGVFDDALLFALIAGTEAAAAFVSAAGPEAAARLARVRRDGRTALEILVDAMQSGSFLHNASVGRKHAELLLAQLPLGGNLAAEEQRALHKLARAGDLSLEAGWPELCDRASLAFEAKLGPGCDARELERRCAFWADQFESANSVLALATHAAAERGRKAAVVSWFFCGSKLHAHGRLLMRPSGNTLLWSHAAAVDLEHSMRKALERAGMVPCSRQTQTLRQLQDSGTKFYAQTIPLDEQTVCILKGARLRHSKCWMGQPRASAASAIVTF